MASSQLFRYFAPVGAGTTFLLQGSILADGIRNRPNPAAVYAEPTKLQSEDTETECSDTELERLVMNARSTVGPAKDNLMCYVGRGAKQITSFGEKVMDNLCYLRTGAPQEVRIGTVVASSLTGMLLGIRGGTIKRLFMGTLGAGGGAYLAYPNETEKYTKKYTAIAYNFVAGPRK